MKAEELRIGNLVLKAPSSDYSDWKEVSINFTYLKLILDNPDDFKGIPLTEARFLKFEIVNFPFEIFKNSNGKYFIVFEDNSALFIEYVHQLQNLYFALTGEELSSK